MVWKWKAKEELDKWSSIMRTCRGMNGIKHPDIVYNDLENTTCPFCEYIEEQDRLVDPDELDNMINDLKVIIKKYDIL